MAATNPEITPELSVAALKGTFPGDLGIELLQIDDREVRGRLTVDRRHLHPGGYVHGGCWVAFADTVAAWGTSRNLAPGKSFTTVELKTNVLAAAGPGDELIGIGEPLHIGSRTQVWEVRIYKNGAPQDGGAASGRLAAVFVCTQIVL